MDLSPSNIPTESTYVILQRLYQQDILFHFFGLSLRLLHFQFSLIHRDYQHECMCTRKEIKCIDRANGRQNVQLCVPYSLRRSFCKLSILCLKMESGQHIYQSMDHLKPRQLQNVFLTVIIFSRATFTYYSNDNRNFCLNQLHNTIGNEVF